MPDGKITWRRLKDHLRRLWLVYLAGIAALCFLNHLVFTMTRPGYSDDETLKIMLLNTDVSIAEDAFLEKVEHLGFRTVETVPLAIAVGDPTSEMLLATQLIAGFGDIYIADAQGLELLNARDACHAVVQAGEGLQLAVAKNGTDVESALAALEILARELGE